ncbi:MAG TPA: aminopeptidase, partial [Anaerolineales bacterium]|nr:aminopeptidase [Anaerolineales bacterium]
MDPRIEKLADILVNYSIEVKKGDWVVINGDAIAAPLVKAATRLVLEAGGNPTILLSDGSIGETQLRYSSDEQLKWVSPVSKLIYEKADAFINIIAGDNTRALSGIDPAKQAKKSAATRELTETFLKRSAAGKLNWVITSSPTPSLLRIPWISRGWSPAPYHGSRAMRRSPSPLAWRPDFPGAPR